MHSLVSANLGALLLASLAVVGSATVASAGVTASLSSSASTQANFYNGNDDDPDNMFLSDDDSISGTAPVTATSEIPGAVLSTAQAQTDFGINKAYASASVLVPNPSHFYTASAGADSDWVDTFTITNGILTGTDDVTFTFDLHGTKSGIASSAIFVNIDGNPTLVFPASGSTWTTNIIEYTYGTPFTVEVDFSVNANRDATGTSVADFFSTLTLTGITTSTPGGTLTTGSGSANYVPVFNGNVTVTVVPEVGTLALGLLGVGSLVGMLALRRRRAV